MWLQDASGIHRAKIVQSFIYTFKFLKINKPPYSPDIFFSGEYMELAERESTQGLSQDYWCFADMYQATLQ